MSSSTSTGSSASPSASCDPCAALILNPNFEDFLDDWAVEDVVNGAVAASTAGTVGSALSVTLPTDGVYVITQTLSTLAGTLYSIEADYYFSLAQKDCYLNAFLDEDWFWSFSPRFNPASVGQWATGVVPFNATACTSFLEIQFLCRNSENVEMRLDNIRWTPQQSSICVSNSTRR